MNVTVTFWHAIETVLPLVIQRGPGVLPIRTNAGRLHGTFNFWPTGPYDLANTNTSPPCSPLNLTCR